MLQDELYKTALIFEQVPSAARCAVLVPLTQPWRGATVGAARRGPGRAGRDCHTGKSSAEKRAAGGIRRSGEGVRGGAACRGWLSTPTATLANPRTCSSVTWTCRWVA